MSIKLSFEKVIPRGVKMYRLVGFEMLGYKELPEEYLTKPPYVHAWREDFSKDAIVFAGDGAKSFADRLNADEYYIRIGWVITPEQLKALLSFVEKAGDRLEKINKRIREDTKSWYGTETYII